MNVLLLPIFIVVTWASDAALVQNWLARQPDRWDHVSQCRHVAVLFSDAAWLRLTNQVMAELEAPGVCFALWLWIDSNSSAVQLCEQPHVPCFIDRRHVAPTFWGRGHYFNKISHRVPIVSALAQRLSISGGIAMVDSDVVFFRRRFFDRIARNHNATVVVQQEWPCYTAPLRLCANGGVWWVRLNDGGRRFLTNVAKTMQRLAVPDQDAIDIVLAGQTEGFVHYLDRLKFANGKTFRYDAAWRRASTHMVHTNCPCSLAVKEAMLQQLRKLSS